MVPASSWTWSPATSSSPGPKVSGHACSAASTNPDKLLLFGGLTGSAGSPTTADLWMYDDEGEWDLFPRKMQGISCPGRRMYSASAVVDGSFYLFGGWEPGEPGSGGKFLDDI